MAKKRQKKDEKKLEEPVEEEELGIKKWIIKTISMMAFLIFLVIMTQWMFDVQIINDVLISISIIVN